jgi:hypothetical protein
MPLPGGAPPHVHTVPAAAVALESFSEVNQLRAAYYDAVLTDVTPDQVDSFVHETVYATWLDPNLGNAVAGLHENQILVNPRATFAYDYGGSLMGLARTAQNASSHEGLPQWAQTLERQAKLRFPVPRFRHFVIRELIGTSAPTVDSLLEKTLEEAEPRQPIKAYVFDAERPVIEGLERFGFSRAAGFAVPHPRMTTNDGEPVMTRMYTRQPE